MIGVALIWGAALPVIKYTLQFFSPLVFLTYRLAISSAIALVFLFLKRPNFSKVTPQESVGLLLYSTFAVTISLGMLFLGMKDTSATLTGVIHALGPIVTTVGGLLLFREKVSKSEGFGIVLAFIGTIVTVVTNLDGSGKPLVLTGIELVALSMLADAISTLIARRMMKHHELPAETITHLSFIIGFLSIIPFVFYGISLPDLLSSIAHAPLQAHLGVFYMAIFSGTIAYIMRNIASGLIEAGEVSVFNYAYPLISTPLSILWLGELINPWFIPGSVLIAVGVTIAEYHKRKHIQPKMAKKRGPKRR
jgi:drug/metabolite transporter (DMT)-like permease